MVVIVQVVSDRRTLSVINSFLDQVSECTLRRPPHFSHVTKIHDPMRLVVLGLVGSLLGVAAERQCSLKDVGNTPFGPYELSDCTKLDLTARSLGDFGAKALAEALKKPNKLKSLDLYFNYIRDEGAIAIADALAAHKTLVNLTMESNNIGDEGATAFGELLQTNTVLQNLFLKHNIIGSLGASGLAEGLKQNQVLRTLYLRRNQVGDEGASALAEVLPSTQIRWLNLRRNHVGDKGATDLAAAASRSPNLRRLDLRYNHYTSTGKDALDKVKTKALKVDSTETEKLNKGLKDLLASKGGKRTIMKVNRGKREGAGAF